MKAWMQEARALSKRASACQRDAATVHAARAELDLGEIYEERRRADEARREKLDEVRASLRARKAALAKIRGKIEALASGGALAPDLQTMVAAAEDDTQRFKAAMRVEYADLVAVGKALKVEIDAASRKFESWATDDAVAAWVGGSAAATAPGSAPESARRAGRAPVRGDAVHPRSASLATAAASAVTLTARVDALIAHEGGVTGGWPQHEHDTFLRLWVQLQRPTRESDAAKTAAGTGGTPALGATFGGSSSIAVVAGGEEPPPPRLDAQRRRALLQRAAAALPERGGDE
ncbi:unnamed protein product, partial [Phaeothamnion confervicola]